MKRVVSCLLAAALVLALLPTFAFAANETAESYVYNFKSGLHSSSAYVTQCTEWTSTDSAEGEWVCVTYNHTGSGTNAGKHNTNWFSFRPKVSSADMMPTYSPGIAIDSSTQFMSALTFKIEVKQGGIYTPSASIATEDSSPKWELFLTKADETVNSASHSSWVGSLDSSNWLGTIDGYGSGQEVSKTFLNRELEAGSYYLTFVANGKNDLCEFTKESNFYRVELLLKSFKLINTEVKAPLFEYDISLNAFASGCEKIVDNAKVSLDSKNVLSSDLDSSKTTLYSINLNYFRNNVIARSYIDSSGLQAGLYVNYCVDPENVPEHLKELYPTFAFKGTKDGAGVPDVSEPHVAVALGDLNAGEYKISIFNEVCTSNYGAHTKVYFGKAPASTANATLVGWRSSGGDGELIGWHNSQISNLETNPETFTVNVNEDAAYYLVFVADEESLGENKNPVLNTSNSEQYFHLSGIKVEMIEEEPESNLVAEQQKFDEIKETKANEIAAAVASGLSNTATVNILTTEINGDKAFDETAKQVTGLCGKDIKVTAEEKEGYDFLYWAKGIGANRKAVSEDAEYTFKATSGGTWLTAVYKDKASNQIPVVFYNGNGEEVGRRLVDAGSEIAMPSLPSLRGHEPSIGWALGNANALYQPDDTVIASGSRMLFVAQFNDPAADTITVKVNGKEYDKFAYGEKVTVTATERENGSGAKVFVYWKKDGEIVSFDKTYSFLADADCELEACYESYKPITEALRKIIIKADGQNLIAEFIGIDTAVEKGIIFGGENFGEATHKIAMKQSGNHLSAINDDSLEYIGYAILSDGLVVYDK